MADTDTTVSSGSGGDTLMSDRDIRDERDNVIHPHDDEGGMSFSASEADFLIYLGWKTLGWALVFLGVILVKGYQRGKFLTFNLKFAYALLRSSGS